MAVPLVCVNITHSGEGGAEAPVARITEIASEWRKQLMAQQFKPAVVYEFFEEYQEFDFVVLLSAEHLVMLFSKAGSQLMRHADLEAQALQQLVNELAASDHVTTVTKLFDVLRCQGSFPATACQQTQFTEFVVDCQVLQHVALGYSPKAHTKWFLQVFSAERLCSSSGAGPVLISGKHDFNDTSNRPRKRRKRDPRRPAGYISGFNFFAKDCRSFLFEKFPRLQVIPCVSILSTSLAWPHWYQPSTARFITTFAIRQQDSAIPNNEINKLVGRLWKSLSQAHRAIFEERSRQDKLRYLQEMKEYEPAPGFARKTPRIRPISLDGDGSGLSGAAGGAEQPKQAQTAYETFVDLEYKHLLDSGAEKVFSKLNSALSLRWRLMSAEERQLYEDITKARSTV